MCTHLHFGFAVLQSAHPLRYVCSADNRVPFEHAAGAPFTYLHNHGFGNPHASQIARYGPSQVLED
jgi:hypothetical protein